MTIYLASGNQHKKEEFVALFKKFHISTPADMKLTFAPQETGQTFLENALLKAHALYDIVHAPVIADDSGLCIDALDGKPGIYSARYGEKEAHLLKDSVFYGCPTEAQIRTVPPLRQLFHDEKSYFFLQRLVPQRFFRHPAGIHSDHSRTRFRRLAPL